MTKRYCNGASTNAAEQQADRPFPTIFSDPAYDPDCDFGYDFVAEGPPFLNPSCFRLCPHQISQCLHFSEESWDSAESATEIADENSEGGMSGGEVMSRGLGSGEEGIGEEGIGEEENASESESAENAEERENALVDHPETCARHIQPSLPSPARIVS